MTIRLTQLDGKLPNLALMKLAHWHNAKGDTVHFEKSVYRNAFEPAYDCVYGSAIFSDTAKKIEIFKTQFPTALIAVQATI